MSSRYSASTVCFTHFSGRVLHQQVCFAPAGVFCTGGVFCTSVRFTHFSGRVLHRRCVLHFFRVCFAPAGCFAPACFLRIFPGVFCTDGVFCVFSGRVLQRRGVLNQHAFYAFFRACFAPTVRLTFFPGERCTGGAFCGSSGIFLAVCAFYGFCRGVPHSRRVSRHGVFCPRACDTAQACAPCRCVTHTRGVWH
jgi:hypothetical protein